MYWAMRFPLAVIPWVMSVRGGLAALIPLVLAACASGDEAAEPPGRAEQAVSVDGCGGGPTVENGGFETGTFLGWSRHGRAALVPKHHSGTGGLRLARVTASAGLHWVQQAVQIPEAADGASSLSLWMQPHCAGAPDYRRVEVREVGGPRLATLLKDCTSSAAWQQHTFDLSPWAGQEVVLRVTANDDGILETPSYFFVDDIQVLTEVAPPSVVITDPVDGDNLPRVATVTATARVSACTGLDRIELHRDGVLVATSPSSPATAEFDLGPSGAHTILARAFDDLGGIAEWSVGVTSPCAVTPGWTVPHVPDGTFPVTPVAAANGVDPDGIPRLAAFIGLGDRIEAVDARTGGPLGSVVPGGLVEKPPLVVESATGTYLFFASKDGFLYRKQMVGGLLVDAGARDLRRYAGQVLVCPSDGLTATPTLVKKSLSTASYPWPGDLIVVGTHTACSDHMRNRFFAFDPAAAMDAPPLWTVNTDGILQIDFSQGSCAVDYAFDRVYCGTNREAAAPSSQQSLFAIDVRTGALVWTRNLGPLYSRPVLNPVSRHLFVASLPGTLSAIDPDNLVDPGHVDWMTSVASPGATIEADMWAETRGFLAGTVFVVDSFGILRMVADNGTSSTVNWSEHAVPGENFTGEPAVVVSANGASGYVYMGSDVGRIYEIALRQFDPHSISGWRYIDEGFLMSTAGALLLPNALIAHTSMSSRRFCAPFLNGAPF